MVVKKCLTWRDTPIGICLDGEWCKTRENFKFKLFKKKRRGGGGGGGGTVIYRNSPEKVGIFLRGKIAAVIFCAV